MNIQRIFLPGDKWLYYKLYCGLKGADHVISITIYDIIKKLQKDNIIEKWFFIRYYDPEYHLRIRFLVRRQEYIQLIIKIMNESINRRFKEKMIWKIQIDTYERELERYKSIEKSESIFHIDSEMNLLILKSIKGNNTIKWKIAICIIELYLSFLGPYVERKLRALDYISNSFKKEFGFNEYNSKTLNAAYREHKGIIDAIITKKYNDREYIKCLNIIEKSKKNINKYYNNETDDYIELADYIHMSFNRLFMSEGKKYELLLYVFLDKYYKSEIAKAKINILYQNGKH